MDERVSAHEFGGFVLRISSGTLEKDGQLIALRAKVFALLCHFVAHAGRIVSRQELVDALWDGLAISDDAITQTVRDLRKALDDPKGQLVRTVPKRGYLFTPRAGSYRPAPPTVTVAQRDPPPARTEIDLLRAHVSENLSDGPLADVEGSTTEGIADQRSVRRVPAGTKPVVAILPLDVSPAGPDTVRTSLWADGLVRDVVRQLSRAHSLFVLAVATTQAVSRKGIAGLEAARLLRADYFCAGTIHVIEDRFHVDLELVDAGDGRALWGDCWIGEMRDVSRTGSDIAREIVSAVATHVDIHVRELSLRREIHKLEGWESFHHGLSHMDRFTAEDNAAVESLVRGATGRNASLVRARAGLSVTHWLWASVLAPGSAVEEVARAQTAAIAGVAADPLEPAAQAALGRALWLWGDAGEAAATLALSLGLNPSSAFGHYATGFLECAGGDATKGIEARDVARSLSPPDPLFCARHASRAIGLLWLGRYEEAAAWALHAACQSSAHANVKRIGAVCLAAMGRFDEARDMARALQSQFPDRSGEVFIGSLRLHTASEFHFRALAREAGLLRSGAAGA